MSHHQVVAASVVAPRAVLGLDTEPHQSSLVALGNWFGLSATNNLHSRDGLIVFIDDRGSITQLGIGPAATEAADAVRNYLVDLLLTSATNEG
jgi:hypothetical protein